jgi:hypothetical protein
VLLELLKLMPRPTFLILLAIPLLLLAGCATPPYTYQYVPGRTAVVRDGYAIAPPKAPPAVHAAIAAGNRIAGLPYRYGGGHGRGIDSGYDCSGAASYVLQATGRLRSSTTSAGFRRFGESGPGRWISIYARRDHVFLVVAGLRFDTGYTRQGKGPRWTTRSRPANGAVIRHPRGL